MNADGTVAGTGLTPDELAATGYSTAEILQLDPTAYDISTSGGLPSFIGPLPPTPGPGPDSSGSSGTGGGSGSSWLSALTGLGSVFTNVFRAVNPPAVGTRLFNPMTGLPYTQAQLAGTSSIGGNLLPLLFLILIAWLIFKK